MTPERWSYAEGRLLALRRVTRSERPEHGSLYAATLLLLNAFSEDREFVLPSPAVPWRVAIDAAEPVVDPAAEPNQGSDLQPARQQEPDNNRITVAAHSAMLLVADNVTF